MENPLKDVGLFEDAFGLVESFRLHDFFADSFVFFENLLVDFLHDFAVEGGEKGGFFESFVIPLFNGFNFGEEQVITFFNVIELF